MSYFYEALNNLRPLARWAVHGAPVYENLEWDDENQTKPTEQELNTERERLQAEYNAKAYQRQRAAEYPSIVDQLDTLYHGGYDAWRATIQAVKDKYPKGVA
jgi:hypothetical protein